MEEENLLLHHDSPLPCDFVCASIPFEFYLYPNTTVEQILLNCTLNKSAVFILLSVSLSVLQTSCFIQKDGVSINLPAFS